MGVSDRVEFALKVAVVLTDEFSVLGLDGGVEFGVVRVDRWGVALLGKGGGFVENAL